MSMTMNKALIPHLLSGNIVQFRQTDNKRKQVGYIIDWVEEFVLVSTEADTFNVEDKEIPQCLAIIYPVKEKNIEYIWQYDDGKWRHVYG